MVSVKASIELQVEKLRRVCDPGVFKFESTAELSVLEEIIGQERAVRATFFGIDIESPGYQRRRFANWTRRLSVLPLNT